MRRRPKILNSQGKVVTLDRWEQARADFLQRKVENECLHIFQSMKGLSRKMRNSLAYEVDITTLTTILKKITTQKYFEVAPAKYLPIRVGEGAWSTKLTTYRSFVAGDDFETGILNTGGDNARLATVNAAVDSVTVDVESWAKSINWTLIDIAQAALAGNWDLIEALEKARKKNWDLGIQRVAFLGARGLNGSSGPCLGLLNQAGITNNTTVIPKPISAMDPDELNTFCRKVYEAYRANNHRTAVPSRFILPESDYNGLASQSSPEFPVKSKKQLLTETFKDITGREDFDILPLAYADWQYHKDVTSIVDTQVYTLLNYDDESIRADIPVDYSNTMQNTIDGFSFQSAGYGQFTGVKAYRPLEMMYFTHPKSVLTA